MTDEERNIEERDIVGPDVAEEAPPQYGVGPFSIREVILVGVWLVAFAVSFFSLSTVQFQSVWTAGLWWVLTIAVPTVAVFLIVLRRLSPQGIRRVGSLGIDQFASVAFSVSAVLWLQLTWETVAFVLEGGPWLRSWVMWVELVLMIAGVVLTVLAPFIPGLEEDFQFRPEIPAHRNARPIRPVVARPKRERPAPSSAPAAVAADLSSPYDADRHETGVYDSAANAAYTEAPAASEAETTAVLGTGEATPAAAPTAQQAFWALPPVERDVVDERGRPIFRIGPTAWALVIEDRGDTFVVRSEDGRIGYLHDVSDVIRG